MYKGKTKDGWVFGNLIQKGNRMFILSNGNRVAEIDPATLCRFFEDGFWENDIVKYDEERYGIVKFGVYDHKHYGFYIEWHGDTTAMLRKDILFWMDKVEIVGNMADDDNIIQKLII